MVAQHAQRYVVSCRSDLAVAYAAIDRHSEPIVVEAVTDSNVLTGIDEFRTLASRVSAAGGEVSFASDDPLRRELARIAGMTVIEPAPVSSGVRRAIDNNAPTRKIDRVEPVTEPIDRPLPESADELDDESYASFAFVVNPPMPRRAEGHQNTWYYDGTPHPAPARHYRPNRRAGKAAGAAALIVLAVFLASAGLMAAVIVPRATVTLIPATSSIGAEIEYGIAGFSNNADVVIEPVSVSGEIAYSATIPTTGIRTETDGFATGEISFMNPQTFEIVLPAGTTFANVDGLTFATAWEIIVPPADPFGSGAMGYAAVPVEATAAGPDSNLPAQALEGQLDSGLFYSNREALSGGTVREIAVVAEADLEALRTGAEESLSGRSAEEITALVPEGFVLVEGSLSESPIEAAFNLAPGVDADEISIEATLPMSALAYDPVALQEMAEAELRNRLIAAVPGEHVLLANSVTTSDPEPIATDPDNPTFRMSADARVRATMDQATLDALRADLVGASPEEAAAKVVLLNNVAGFQIEHGPDWFPFDWPPRLESRIAIIIDDSATTQEAEGTAGP